MVRTQSGNPEITVGSFKSLRQMCVAQLCARRRLVPRVQRLNTRLVFERLIGLGRVPNNLLEAKVHGEYSSCYSKLDSALIFRFCFEERVQGSSPRSARMLFSAAHQSCFFHNWLLYFTGESVKSCSTTIQFSDILKNHQVYPEVTSPSHRWEYPRSRKEEHKTLLDFQGEGVGYEFFLRLIFFLSFSLRYETSEITPLFVSCMFNLCGFSLWSLRWGQL